MKNMEILNTLPTPEEIKTLYPLSFLAKDNKLKIDKEIEDIFNGISHKFLIITGPCSADREAPVLDYVTKLRPVQDRLFDKIIILPRIYICKPRTNGNDYKGMFHQPILNGPENIYQGLLSSRKLFVDVLEQTGFSAATELLYPDHYDYFEDTLSYVTIGTRSVENQQHRLVASGLSVPVGMKNPQSGNPNIMINAVKTAQAPHIFEYRGYEVCSKGNPFAHGILRGYINSDGTLCPNYKLPDLQALYSIYADSNCLNTSIIIDTNHANSGKNFIAQIDIAKNVMLSRKADSNIKNLIKGLMIESYLEDGCQPVSGSVYGRSITDPCLGFEKTVQLIYEIADML